MSVLWFHHVIVIDDTVKVLVLISPIVYYSYKINLFSSGHVGKITPANCFEKIDSVFVSIKGA